MGGRYYKDPTADVAMANVKKEVRHRKDEEEKLRKNIQQLFLRMRNIGMARKEMVEMLRNEYEKFIRKCN